MKKLVLLFILPLAAASAFAQSIQFKIKFLPHRQYIWNITNDLGMVMSMEDSTNSVAPFPMKFTASSTTKLNIQTGALGPDNWCPMAFLNDEIVSKILINGEERPMPANPMVGHKVYAKYKPTGEIKIDSIPGVSDPAKQSLTAFVEALQKRKWPACAGHFLSAGEEPTR